MRAQKKSSSSEIKSKSRSRHPKLLGFLAGFAVVGLMLVGLVEVVTGLRLDTPPPNSLLLDDSEVPDGLVPTAVEGSTPVQPGFAVRVWRSEDVKLSIVAGLTSSPNSAAAALREVPDYFRSQGLHPIPLPQVEGGGAATGTIAVDGEQQQVSGAFFARGKVLFLVTAAVMDSDSATASFDLVTDVAVQQASKAGQLYTSTPSTTLNIAYSVGGLLGSVLGIFFVFGLWAYVRSCPRVISASLAMISGRAPPLEPPSDGLTGIFVSGCPLASSRKTTRGLSISIRVGMNRPRITPPSVTSVESRSAENQGGESAAAVSPSSIPEIPADCVFSHQSRKTTRPP